MGCDQQRTAEACGLAGQSAQNNLCAALLDSVITFDEFNSKLITLDQFVVGFAEMAKTFAGGIATAFTNMDTCIAAGVTERISGIDSGLPETRFKSIGKVVSNTGTTIKNALTAAAPVAAAPAANLDTLAVATIGVGTTVAAYKIMLPVTVSPQLVCSSGWVCH